MRAKDHFAEKPPDYLFHYTTLQGLVGILASKTVWATQVEYLNDKREFIHAIDAIYDFVDELRTDANGRVIDRLPRALKRVGDGNVCVASFSLREDDLSQWRAYTGGAPGFAVAFRGTAVRKMADDAQFWMARCLYERNAQLELLKSLLGDVIDQELNSGIAETGVVSGTGRPVGNLVPYLQKYAPVIKDEAFRGEEEWRVISTPLPPSELNFRAGKSMVLPYCEVPFPAHAVVSVCVGPTPHPELSARSAHLLLESLGYKDIPVSRSSVPYRNW